MYPQRDTRSERLYEKLAAWLDEESTANTSYCPRVQPQPLRQPRLRPTLAPPATRDGDTDRS